jgi:hypothetical protein
MRVAHHRLQVRPRLPLAQPRQGLAAIALLAAGVTVWTLSLSSFALDRMTDIGLASALPPGTWVALGLVTVGSALAWRTGHEGLMAAATVTTILVLHGLGVLGEPTMRFGQSWRHVGVVDYVMVHGSVNGTIDALFDWPGFFVLGAFLTEVAGLHNAEPIARAAPLILNALYLPPLVVIARAVLTDPRSRWLGIWFFYVCNWIGQDYVSPQGLSYFLYLVVVAVVLTWFRSGSAVQAWFPASGRTSLAPAGGALWRRWTANAAIPPAVRSSATQRVALIAGLALIAVAIVASHQLTPFAVVAATAALALARTSRLVAFPAAVLLIALVWASYVAEPYLVGHLAGLASDVGAVGTTVHQNVGARVRGSAGHEHVVYARVASVALLWGMAAIGVLLQARAGRLATDVVALAAAPFPLVALQAYGGEVLQRISLFSLPFMALLAATAFIGPGGMTRSRAASLLLACVAALLVLAFPVLRYGNEREDYYSPAEIAAVDELYRLAPPHSVLVAASAIIPWRNKHYADYDYRTLEGGEGAGGGTIDLEARNRDRLVRAILARMSSPDGRASFLIITRSMKAQVALFGPWHRHAYDRLERILTASPQFRVVFSNRDATILTPRSSRVR